MKPESKLKVAVWMVTYNHEHFIQEAVESIMMQQASFNFKLFIGEDCSTDNTRKLCLELQNKYPNKIELVLNKDNLGPIKNAFQIYEKCYQSDAKYVALCEGDDFWIDPLKLQKQVDFLESNPDYQVCFTNINIINDQGVVVKDQLIPSKRRTTFEHKHLPIWAPTLTRVYRNIDFKPIESSVLGQDTLLLLYQSKFGKLKFLNEITGTYRLHEGSIYSSKSDVKKKESVFLTNIESLKLIDRFLFPKYFGILFKKLAVLKTLDKESFRINKMVLKKAYHDYASNFSMLERLKICISFMVISMPFVYKNSNINTLIIRIFNRFFLYNQFKNE